MKVSIKCVCKNCGESYQTDDFEVDSTREELLEALKENGKWTGQMSIHECASGEIGFGDPVGMRFVIF